MKTLTIEHIASYLPYGLKMNNQRTGRIYTMNALGFYTFGTEEMTYDWVDLSECKPILTPLDKLTDAQYVELGRIYGHEFVYAQDWFLKKNYLALVKFKEAVQVLQYLLSLRCDIYGLIPAGLAISAYDLPENPYT